MSQNIDDLIKNINQDLPSNVFTIEEDNDPYVILGKINEVITHLKEIQATISSSDEKANNAVENALVALTTARESITASTNALDSSNNALETANLAIDTANTSMEMVVEANANSNNALNISNESKQVAQNALQVAQEALNHIASGVGSKIFDTNNEVMSNAYFKGENGVEVVMDENNANTFSIRLSENITSQINDIFNNTLTILDHTESIENKVEHIEERVENLSKKLTLYVIPYENWDNVARIMNNASFSSGSSGSQNCSYNGTTYNYRKSINNTTTGVNFDSFKAILAKYDEGASMPITITISNGTTTAVNNVIITKTIKSIVSGGNTINCIDLGILQWPNKNNILRNLPTLYEDREDGYTIIHILSSSMEDLTTLTFTCEFTEISPY